MLLSSHRINTTQLQGRNYISRGSLNYAGINVLVCISLCVTGVHICGFNRRHLQDEQQPLGRILPFFDSTFNPTSALAAPALDPPFCKTSNFTTQIFVNQCSRIEMLKNRGLYFEKTLGVLSSSHPSTCRSATAFKIMLIILSGDVELHPGPTKSIPAFPCTMCSAEVSDDDWALECDKCNQWSHIECCDINDEECVEFQINHPLFDIALDVNSWILVTQCFILECSLTMRILFIFWMNSIYP